MMWMESNRFEAEVDEYLWPLTGSTAYVDWNALAEELRIRKRLGQITAHVHEMHVHPRLRRFGSRLSSTAIAEITAGVIVGPPDGPPWLQTLKEPVPRALREEWPACVGALRP